MLEIKPRTLVSREHLEACPPREDKILIHGGPDEGERAGGREMVLSFFFGSGIKRENEEMRKKLN